MKVKTKKPNTKQQAVIGKKSAIAQAKKQRESAASNRKEAQKILNGIETLVDGLAARIEKEKAQAASIFRYADGLDYLADCLLAHVGISPDEIDY